MTDAEISGLASAIAQDHHTAAVYVDREGVIRSWNLAAETVFGYRAIEAIGKRSDLIIPDSMHDLHWAGFGRAIGTAWRGSGEWGPIEPLHANGQPLQLEVFLIALREGVAPLATGVLALFRSAELETA